MRVQYLALVAITPPTEAAPFDKLAMMEIHFLGHAMLGAIAGSLGPINSERMGFIYIEVEFVPLLQFDDFLDGTYVSAHRIYGFHR